MSSVGTLHRVAQSIRDAAVAVGWTEHERRNGGVLLVAPDGVNVVLEPVRQFNQGKASALFSKVMTHGDKELVAQWREQHGKESKPAPLTQRIVIPDTVKQAVTEQPAVQPEPEQPRVRTERHTDRSYKRTWPDGHIDYVCAQEGCGYANASATTVGAHHAHAAGHANPAPRGNQHTTKAKPAELPLPVTPPAAQPIPSPQPERTPDVTSAERRDRKVVIDKILLHLEAHPNELVPVDLLMEQLSVNRETVQKCMLDIQRHNINDGAVQLRTVTGGRLWRWVPLVPTDPPSIRPNGMSGHLTTHELPQQPVEPPKPVQPPQPEPPKPVRLAAQPVPGDVFEVVYELADGRVLVRGTDGQLYQARMELA